MDYQVIAEIAQAVFSFHHCQGTQLNWFNVESARTLRYIFVDLLNSQSPVCTGAQD